MANTTNFNWETPDDTDLVKDGAAAMRTLGNSIDTSFVDLKGGTTGQILSKASNTDLDYTWVTTDDANAIQNAIVDAKGDLIAASANDTPARLAVGNNGETLVADSSATTGLRYSATPSASNPVLNSAFQIAQRGTSFTNPTSLSTYSLDRWQIYSAGASGRTFSRQTTSDTTNLPNIQYCMRVARDNGNTLTDLLYLWQSFETVNSIPYAGKTVTMSFYARRGANYSAASNFLGVKLLGGTGTDQNGGLGYTGAVNIIDQNATLTTTWQRFTYTATVGTTITEITPYFQRDAVGTAGAADYYEITGVQIDIGSVALPFRTNGATIQGELAACCYYYERLVSDATYNSFGAGFFTSGSRSNNNVNYQRKRVVPSIAFSNVGSWFGSGSIGAASIASSYIGKTSAMIDASVTGASQSVGAGAMLCGNNNTAAYIEVSAEL